MPAKAKRIQLIYVVYWILLAYIIAALVFWFIALTRQNLQMTSFKIEKLIPASPTYSTDLAKINKAKNSKIAQYIGEGSTFLVLILTGAIFIFRAVRRQFKQNQEQQNFMMAITHELKTPIATTRLNLETLQKRQLEDPQRRRLIQNTLQEADRLDALCNNLLVSSQMESKAYNLTLEKIDWSILFQQCLADFKQRHPEREIIAELLPASFINGDENLLHIAANNLLDNAQKYSPKDAPIIVVMHRNSDRISVEVIDKGVGIPEEDKEKIFEKFYRVGNEATKRAKGTGLGLYITSRIMQAHKGLVVLSDAQNGGSNFVLSLKAI